MSFMPDNPLIVQSDRTLVLHTVRAVVDAKGRPQKDADGRPVTEVRLQSGTRVRLGMAHFEILLRGDEVMLMERGRDETGTMAVVSPNELQLTSRGSRELVFIAVFVAMTIGFFLLLAIL